MSQLDTKGAARRAYLRFLSETGGQVDLHNLETFIQELVRVHSEMDRKPAAIARMHVLHAMKGPEVPTC